MSRLLFLGALALSLLWSAEAQGCPPATSGIRIPGCWGEPGCAYVIASDLGPGAACKFDYCNCGGIVGPLLPMTLSGTPTVGCNAYTTVPSAKSCPTAPANIPAPPTATATSVSPGGGGSGGGLPSESAGPGGAPVQLPTPVTTGGPISTVSNAFDTAAPSVTIFSYSGGALTYTRKTFSDQTTVTTPTTITTTITNTAPGGSLSTCTGPIIVGSGGLWWGPPGTAPDCIWPICTSSGLGGASGCGGGSGGGIPGGGSPGGSGGGEVEEEPLEVAVVAAAVEEPLEAVVVEEVAEVVVVAATVVTEARDPTVNLRPKRVLAPDPRRNDPYSTTLPTVASPNAQKKTLSRPIHSKTHSTPSVKIKTRTASQAAHSTAPKEYSQTSSPRAARTPRLEGHFKLPNKVTIGTGDNQQTFQANENLFWRVRWDFDPTKGPHVNAQFGTKPSSKFAFRLDPSKFTNGDPGASMGKVAQDKNKLVQYSKADNDRKSEPNFDKAGGKDKVIENLKTAWKAIAEGPC